MDPKTHIYPSFLHTVLGPDYYVPPNSRPTQPKKKIRFAKPLGLARVSPNLIVDAKMEPLRSTSP